MDQSTDAIAFFVLIVKEPTAKINIVNANGAFFAKLRQTATTKVNTRMVRMLNRNHSRLGLGILMSMIAMHHLPINDSKNTHYTKWGFR